MSADDADDRTALRFTVGCLSLFIPGLGQIGLYAQLDDDAPPALRDAAKGVAKRGAILLAVAVVTLGLGGLLNLWAAWDAVKQAKRLESMARPEPEPEPEPGPEPAPAPPEVAPLPDPTPTPAPQEDPYVPRPPAVVQQEYLARFPDHMRRFWTPQLQPGEGPARGSRFGGRPWLPAGTSWPDLEGEPLTLHAQIDLGQVPGRPFGEGLLQVFLFAEDVPFETGPGLVARVLPDGAPGALADWPDALHKSHRFEATQVVGWDAGQEPPLPAEFTEGNLAKALSQEDDAWIEDLLEADDEWLSLHDLVRDHDKMGGWPLWVQSVDPFHLCPDCQAPMRLLLQMGSYQALQTSWGDCGNAYLFQCADHPERFRWEVQGH